MAARCKICLSDQCNEINRLLVRGVRPADIAQAFQQKVGTVERHRKNHVPKMLALAHQEKLALGADSIARELARLYQNARELFDQARAEVQLRESGSQSMDRAFMMAVTSLREVARLLEVAERMVQKFPPEKQEIVIRIKEEDTLPRDQFSDTLRLPGPQTPPTGSPGGGEPGAGEGGYE